MFPVIRTVILATMMCVGLATEVGARRIPPRCPGAYVSQSAAIFGTGGPALDTVVVRDDGQVEIPAACPPTPARFRRIRGRIHLRAAWRRCEPLGGRVRLVAVVGSSCEQLDGVSIVKRRRARPVRTPVVVSKVSPAVTGDFEGPFFDACLQLEPGGGGRVEMTVRRTGTPASPLEVELVGPVPPGVLLSSRYAVIPSGSDRIGIPIAAAPDAPIGATGELTLTVSGPRTTVRASLGIIVIPRVRQPAYTAGVDPVQSLAAAPDGTFWLTSRISVAGIRFPVDRNRLEQFGGGLTLQQRTDLRFSAPGFPAALLVETDGKVVVGFARGGAQRFSAEGAPEMTFASKVLSDAMPALALDQSQRILMVQQVGPDVVVARFERAGTFDPAFGPPPGGITLLEELGEVTGAAVQPNGGVLLVGTRTVGIGTSPGQQVFLSRLTAAGDLDSSFGGDGQVEVFSGRPAGVSLHRGGIVVGGTESGGSHTVQVVARYAAEGTLDATFGAGGFARVDYGLDATARALAVLADGRIVLGGGFGSIACPSSGPPFGGLALTRLTTDGHPDEEFGPGGRVTAPFPSILGASHVVAVPDGGVILADPVTNRIARFLP